MKPRPEEDMGSLDSLLDTMTNVVGILVIVLIISQVKMSQAVDKVYSDLPVISEAQHAELKLKIEAYNRKHPEVLGLARPLLLSVLEANFENLLDVAVEGLVVLVGALGVLELNRLYD